MRRKPGYPQKVSYMKYRLLTQKNYLTPSQTSPGFYVSAVELF